MDGWTGAHLPPNHMLFLYPLLPTTPLRMTTCNDKKSKERFYFFFFILYFSFLPSRFEIGGKEHDKKLLKMYRKNH